MKRAGNTEYIIYTVGAFTGIILTVQMYLNSSFYKIIATLPIVGKVAVEDVVLSVMLLTVIYGLAVILPLLPLLSG